MLTTLRKIFSNTALPEPPPIELPPNHRVYCIGDIHGRSDLLHELQKKIAEDRKGFSGRVVLVYLGDYIDRGASSAEVLESLIDHPDQADEVIYLRGNHEQVMLDFLADARVGRNWFMYGGLDTLMSYRVPIRKLPSSDQDLEEIRQTFARHVPKSHLHFLQQTLISHTLGNCFFVHAGINPSLPLAAQHESDLLWIKEPFVHADNPYEKLIVHGHTITDGPDIHHNRIGLDTGAFQSGILTCGVLEESQLRIIQTGHEAG